MNLYSQLENGERIFNKKLGRVLWMVYEHEGWHAETLLYMLLQKAGDEGGTLAPPGVSPPWIALPNSSSSVETSAPPDPLTVTLGPETVHLGHVDLEAEDTLEENHPKDDQDFANMKKWEFGWDNESSTRIVEVKKFKISKKCVTNTEYRKFFLDEKQKGRERPVPKSWVEKDGKHQVRTLYGPVSFDIAGDWPFISSYDDLSAYATVQGGRLPTEAELRLFMDRFLGGEGSSWGWKKWHFTSGDVGGDGGERGHNGGVWEWTSSVFDKWEGFTPSSLYPGYSADFFDQCHQTVLGGSFATIPRIGQRRSARNYYQHNYPYAWIGGRIAYDI
jgi:formylglycine-generating enzyme required for sulfatase activity